MFTKVLLCCLVAYVASQAVVEQYPPQPYHFNYDTTDEYGTRMTREETSDANNAKVGSYSYTDANGVARTVKYVADENGFRATVETNEPGTKSHVTGDAEYISNAPDYVAPASPAPARPVVVHAVQAAPVVHAVQATPVVHALQAAPVVHAVHSAPVVHAVQAGGTPVLHAVHTGGGTVALHAAPISYATAHHPVQLTHAPLTYTLGKAKSR
ncbi:cuticle protein 16.8 [Ixodes scapularis]|uniref:cuticle protein 16.8 n=1 Tax=Ixodes scapularis TaxID=6945 RepID=UPI001A9E21C8|nr:cuticle protein 16.8 [Ixodes scapularis]